MSEKRNYTFEDIDLNQKWKKIIINRNTNTAKNIAITILLMINIAQAFSINSLVKSLETTDIFLAKIQHDFQTTLNYLSEHEISIPDDLMDKLYIKKAPIEKF